MNAYIDDFQLNIEESTNAGVNGLIMAEGSLIETPPNCSD